MDHGPLVKDEIEAGAEFLRRFDQIHPIKVAFWLRLPDDEGYRYLYIASDEIEIENKMAVYAELFPIANAMRNIDIDPLRMKLLTGNDPLTQAALQVHRDFPQLIPMRLRGYLGKTSIEDGYLYPLFHEPAVT